MKHSIYPSSGDYNSLCFRERIPSAEKKIAPKPDTLARIQESPIWRMENEFYEFAVQQFHYVKHQTFDLVDGGYVEKGKPLTYARLRPTLSLRPLRKYLCSLLMPEFTICH